MTITLKNLTDNDEEHLERTVGLCRFIYNWTLDTMNEYYQNHKHEEKKYPTDKELQKRLSELRNNTEWLQEVPLGTLRNAMFDALNAYSKWFNKSLKNRKPKYKTKKRSKKSFSPRWDRFYIKNNLVKIEGFNQKINISFDTGFTGTQEERNQLKYANIRVFKDTNGKWKVSFTILRSKVESVAYDPNTGIYTPQYDRAIGIDLNKKNLIVTSYMNGEIYKLPESIFKYIDKWKLGCKQVQRDIKLTMRRYPEITNWEDYDLSDYKSNNAKKRQIKCNKARRKVHDIIITYVHTISKEIITRFPIAIVMEKLDISSWYKHHTQASGIAFIPFYEIREIFKEKCDKYGVPFILADKIYPSTQRCSCCGHIQKMGSKHTYRCPVCGMIKDRDINAAFNLEQLAYKDCIDVLEWIA